MLTSTGYRDAVSALKTVKVKRNHMYVKTLNTWGDILWHIIQKYLKSALLKEKEVVCCQKPGDTYTDEYILTT